MKKKRFLISGSNTGAFVFIMISIAVFISVMAEIFIPTYHTNPLLYAALGGIAGFFFRGGSGQ